MLDTRPLRVATFRHLAAAYTVNEFGNVVGAIALAIMVFNRTDSALATAGLFLALQFLPGVVAQFLTARLEAVPTRKVLPTVYVMEGVIFFVLAGLSRQFSLLAVLVLAAAAGALEVTATALTRSASANHLLRRGLLREGNAILNLGAMGANAIGPVVAGMIVAWSGTGIALLIDAASLALTALIVLVTPRIHIESDAEANTSDRVRTGLRTIRERPMLVRLFVAVGLAITLASIAVPVDIVFIKRTLHGGDTAYGLMQAAWGVGMVIGGTLFAIATRIRVTVVLGISGVLVAIAYAGLALAPGLTSAYMWSALGGVANGVAGIAAVTAIQQAIPLTTQSAVMAVFQGMNQMMPAFGFIAGGVITAAYSPRTAFAVIAIGVGAIVVAAIARPVRTTGDVEGVREEEFEPGAHTADRSARAAWEMASRGTRMPVGGVVAGDSVDPLEMARG